MVFTIEALHVPEKVDDGALGESRSPTQIFKWHLLSVSNYLGVYMCIFGSGLIVMMVMVIKVMVIMVMVMVAMVIVMVSVMVSIVPELCRHVGLLHQR